MRVLVHPNPQLISHADLPRGLGALAVEIDMAGVNFSRGDRSRLEEARGPEPFIQSHAGKLTDGRVNPFPAPGVIRAEERYSDDNQHLHRQPRAETDGPRQ